MISSTNVVQLVTSTFYPKMIMMMITTFPWLSLSLTWMLKGADPRV